MSAADSAATTTAEQDMDAILAREGFEAAPIEHPDNASKDSATKRAREVRSLLTTLPSIIIRAVEASGTTVSGPTGAVLPGASRSVRNTAGAGAKATGVVHQVATESNREQPGATGSNREQPGATGSCARLAALAAREARISTSRVEPGSPAQSLPTFPTGLFSRTEK